MIIVVVVVIIIIISFRLSSDSFDWRVQFYVHKNGG
jgi:hypothetical protein